MKNSSDKLNKVHSAFTEYLKLITRKIKLKDEIKYKKKQRNKN